MLLNCCMKRRAFRIFQKMANILHFVVVISLSIFTDISKSDNIEFFATEVTSVPHGAISKTVSLKETIFFEIINDDSDTKTVISWPVNCWVSEENDGKVQNSPKFLKNGCPIPSTADLYINIRNNRTRVAFTLFPIFNILRKWVYVQCEYVKCYLLSPSNKCPKRKQCYLDSSSSELPYEELPYEYDGPLLLAKSDTKLWTIPPKEESFHIMHPVDKANRDNSKPESDGTEPDQCDCDKPNKCEGNEHKNHTSLLDVKLRLPIVAGIAFVSFVVGFLLMAGICYIERKDINNKRPNSVKNTVNYPMLRIQSNPSYGGSLQPSSSCSTHVYTFRDGSDNKVHSSSA